MLQSKGNRFASVRTVLGAIWLCVAGVPLLAQIDTGSIVGTVRDASGAVVSNATLTATNTATQIALTTKTNESGQYQFTAVRVGTYSVKATMAGFSSQA